MPRQPTILRHKRSVEASGKLGFERPNLPFLGAVELTGVLLVLFARTRVFGAVLLSAYLGGAVAIHVQHSDPLFSHTLFPIIVASLLWGFSACSTRACALCPRLRSSEANRSAMASHLS